MPTTTIRTEGGTGGNQNPDPGTDTREPLGSFTYIDKNGKKVTKTDIEWELYWDSFTQDQRENIRKALINSGYFEPELTIQKTRTAWTDIVRWAVGEANASEQGKKWDLGANLTGAGAGVGQQDNAYLTYGTVLTKPKDKTGQYQTKKDAYLDLKKFVYDNGIVLSDKGLTNYAKLVGMKPSELVVLKDGNKQGEDILQSLARQVGFAEGANAVTMESVKQYLRNKYVLPKYAAFSDEIKAGFDIRDIANDYIQLVAQNLELDPESIDLNDNIIQQALRPAKSGKTYDYISYSDFKNEVRKDPRWAKTQNAKDSISALGDQLFRTFGF